MQNNTEEQLAAIDEELAMAVYNESEARIRALQAERADIMKLLDGPIA